MLLIAGSGPTAQYTKTDDVWDHHTVGPWTFLIREAKGTGTRIAEIRHDDNVLWQARGAWFYWGIKGEGNVRHGLGSDITGDGTPEAVLAHNHGDSRGRNTTHLVFDLLALRSQAPNSRVQELGKGTFEDRDHDGIFEFYERDSIRTDHLSSAITSWSQWPEVCYTYRAEHGVRSGQYAIDYGRMRRPALTDEALQELIDNINQPWDGDSPHNLVIGVAVERMLAMLGKGNHDQAWHFWNSIRPSVEEIWSFEDTTTDLRAMIANGPYPMLLGACEDPSR